MFTRLVLTLLSLFLTVAVAWGQTRAARKYDGMPHDEARRVVKKLVDGREVPPPPGGAFTGAAWTFPEAGFHARGIRIDQRDYAVFAAIQPQHLLFRGGGEEGAFVPNGLFFTSVDLEIADPPSSGIRGRHVIRKGGYLLAVGSRGLWLDMRSVASGDAHEVLLPFKTPIESFSVDPLPLHLIEFTIRRGEVLVQIRGKDIHLR